MVRTLFAVATLILISPIGPASAQSQQHPRADAKQVAASQNITVNWDKVLRVSRTNATLQAVVTPLMARNSPFHDQVWGALKNLNANYVRYVPWLPYPKLGVAELQPPANGKTSWDFSLIDPFTVDFFKANPQLPVIINFSTIPQWMFKTDRPVAYPSDPNHAVWDYTQGTELRDLSMKELAGYFGRLVSWYTKGGFTDEFGHWHASDHHFHFDYWEVLNEIDSEHSMTPEQYTARYDAIVSAIRGVQPQMKFVGLAFGPTGEGERYFEYFLNPAHHKAGIPLDMVSYHFYAWLAADQPMDSWQYTVFDQSAHFIQVVQYVDAIRQRLSPNTKTTIDELGVIAPADSLQGRPDYIFKPFPAYYWNLCAAEYAYLYAELARLGIDAAGESALMQPPKFFPSVSMMNWDTGNPNARYWVLKLIRDNLGPGDKVVDTKGSPTVYARGFVAPDGKKKLLLVNMRSHPADIHLAGIAGSQEEYVDQAFKAPASRDLTSDTVHLQPFAVALVMSH